MARRKRRHTKRAKARKRSAPRVVRRRRRRRNPLVLSNRSRKRRKRRNPLVLSNRSRKRRKHRRRNPLVLSNRKHRRGRRKARRNPFGGLLGQFMGHIKHDVPGGAIAAALDLFVMDKLLPKTKIDSKYFGALKIVGGVGFGILAGKVGFTYAPGIVSGFAALGAKDLIARATASVSPTAAAHAGLQDLAHQYAALVEEQDGMSQLGSGMGDMGANDYYGQRDMADLAGLVDAEEHDPYYS